MNVELIRYTPDALDLLLSTKNTRLTVDSDPAKWSMKEKMESLAYMKDTIKSSWEFVDYIFKIEGVTRAFTHQLVRTRTGSYAQQAMRVVDARDQPVEMPEKLDDIEEVIWADVVNEIKGAYGALIDYGTSPQDARGILPTNITTSIIAKFNLRTLSDMAQLRLCTRTQGEYQNVFRAMREEILGVHEWADDFLQVACVQNGVCAFPRYGKAECPVYHSGLDQTISKQIVKKKFWSLRYEAAPVVKNGAAQ